jgi:hypothetical protein
MGRRTVLPFPRARNFGGSGQEQSSRRTQCGALVLPKKSSQRSLLASVPDLRALELQYTLQFATPATAAICPNARDWFGESPVDIANVTPVWE